MLLISPVHGVGGVRHCFCQLAQANLIRSEPAADSVQKAPPTESSPREHHRTVPIFTTLLV
jgi:hypothetical protein